MTATALSAADAIAFLYGRVDYERVPAVDAARDFKLERIERLLGALSNPHLEIPAVHIAGTKGKGSTAVMTAEILSAAGYRTGLFTSPHVSRFEERMRVDGRSPSLDEVAELVEQLRGPAAALEASDPALMPTFFELTTALAWLYFIRHGAELVVLEVGLGGRLDATNLCRPLATAITNISYDHTDILGRTLASIAAEKAGILKRGVPLVSGVAGDEPREVVLEASRRLEAPLWELGREIRVGERTPVGSGVCASIDVTTPVRRHEELRVPLAGRHQESNAALAVALIDLLHTAGWRVPGEAVPLGLSRVNWPVRIEVVAQRPTVVIDAAHNVASVEALVDTLRRLFPARRRVLVFAAARDKDVQGMLAVLRDEFDAIVLTRYQTNPRAVTVENLAAMLHDAPEKVVVTAPDPAAAWEQARRLAGPDDLICVTGSFFLAAEMRELISPAR
ncbi:MAG: bifunctional folylpolyglutamate synthase/dihydrofolate synthase [Planctomycetes bacterium]|nr:bifunctional folylpolyglutamate synthase/dihydrofolate synthase [Planctomycetota bacterium]